MVRGSEALIRGSPLTVCSSPIMPVRKGNGILSWNSLPMVMLTRSLAILLILGSLAAITFPAFGQEEPSHPSLTLLMAVESSLQHNQGFLAVKEEVEAARGDLLQARRRPNPSVELETRSTRFASLIEGEAGIFLTQELETFGKRGARIKVAEGNLEVAQLRLEDARRVLTREVKEGYVTLLLARDRVTLSQKLVKLQEEFLEIMRGRLKAGDIPEVEVNLAEAESGRTRQREEEFQRDARVALLKLNQVMGSPLDQEYETLEEPGEALPEESPDKLLLLALDQRPDLRMAAALSRVRESELKEQKALGKPNVTVGAGYLIAKERFSQDDVVPEGAFLSLSDTDRMIQLKVGIPLPVFDRNAGNIERARALQREAANLQGFLEENVKEELLATLATLHFARKQVQWYREGLLPQMQENLKRIQTAYRLGGQSIMAVIQAQRTYFEASLESLERVFEVRKAQADLESAVGGTLP